MLGEVSLSLQDGLITIESTSSLAHSVKNAVTALRSKGFRVSSWEYTENGHLMQDSSSSSEAPASKALATRLWKAYRNRQNKKHHVQNCQFCQLKKTEEKHSKPPSGSDSQSTLLDEQAMELRAVFAVGGMTCASCVQSVSEVIGNVLAELPRKDLQPEFSVDLLRQSAIVVLPNKQVVNSILHAIEDAGFSAQLVELLPIQRSISRKITAIIGGITCAACVNSVVSAVNDLPFVLDCGVNAVTKLGQFVLESLDAARNLDLLRSTIEDCGFDFELVSDDKINFSSAKSQLRSINIAVNGMYCKNCPSAVMSYLSNFGEAVVIEDPITLDQPFVRFTYIPNVEHGVGVRRFLSDLNHIHPLEDGYYIDGADKNTFECHLAENVSMDEHLRQLSRKENRKIARRLFLATAVAIPTFVFGVVGMSLISKRNGFRVWLEEPIWKGNVSRVTWILLILSTPVYFFAADIFHVKAFKEVRSLWTQKNNFRKRFFKFGSMSLLMSLGTTVAYVASMVLLILSSRQAPETHMGLHTTYFDSVVFLSFFLLIGRLLESVSKSKTANAIGELAHLKAESATVVERSAHDKYINDEVVPTKLLDAGDYIRIGHGESPAVDCVIVEGSSHFDESALTGESDLVKRGAGQQIFLGTINAGNTAVVARILSMNGDSLLDQIVSTVRDGQMRKAPIQRLADVLTGYFVPTIVMIAVVTWAVWLSLAYSGTLPKSYLDVDIGGWAVWSLEFAIAVFVIACPCGIGLAAPTALFVGSGLAAKYGILAKGGGAAFQDAARVNVICFDKTGTVTHGKMSVAGVALEGSRELCGMALQLARDMELASKHPIACAIREYVQEVASEEELSETKLVDVERTESRLPEVEETETRLPEVEEAETRLPEVEETETRLPKVEETETKLTAQGEGETKAPPLHDTTADRVRRAFEGFRLGSNKVPAVQTIAGKGLRGVPVADECVQDLWTKYRPEEAIMGSEALMSDCGVHISNKQTEILTRWKAERKSIVLVALKCAALFHDQQFHLVAIFACRDEVRAEASAVVRFLSDKGIECWMITGDNSHTAGAIGAEIGISEDHILSQVLPQEKQAQIEHIRKDPAKIVAMVGDGINDAQALSAAHVGIALSSGADIAVTSSDFILLNKSHPLVTLCTLFDLARVVFRRVKFNFAWSLVYNIIGIPIAAGVIYPYRNLRLSPVWASAAMAASSLSVVTSSLLLRLYRPKVEARKLETAAEDDAGVEITLWQ